MKSIIPFVAKRPNGPTPWNIFGSTEAEYKIWAPEICSIACCRSLILARYGNAPTLWELTKEAIELGVFRIEGEKIKGAFHYPLNLFLKKYRISSILIQGAEEAELWNLAKNYPLIVSVNLSAYTKMIGSHLVLIVAVDEDTEDYVIHDSANTICPQGAFCRVSRARFSIMSNAKGLCVHLNTLASRDVEHP